MGWPFVSYMDNSQEQRTGQGSAKPTSSTTWASPDDRCPAPSGSCAESCKSQSSRASGPPLPERMLGNARGARWNASATQAAGLPLFLLRQHNDFMGEFCDVKAITLREARKAQIRSLNHTASLEVVAKILGGHDRSGQSARIHAEHRTLPAAWGWRLQGAAPNISTLGDVSGQRALAHCGCLTCRCKHRLAGQSFRRSG
jgi:hypothetical protein